MSKLLLGILIGALLGCLDGISAYLYPLLSDGYDDVREGILMIIIGSTGKGLVTGLVAGWVATKWNNITIGIICGIVTGGILSYLVAMQPNAEGKHYYWEIIPPGMAVGAIVGFCTQQYGVLRRAGSNGDKSMNRAI